MTQSKLFHVYFKEWVALYKAGAVRDVTLQKYRITLRKLEELIPHLRIKELTRVTYQQLLNDYACTHEKQTTLDFHHQVKSAILDALDDGFILRDPTRKAIIKGKAPRTKKPKYLNEHELQDLIAQLELGNKINWDWLILLIAKTGIRFSESLAVTPKDFDIQHKSLNISKTWDYKSLEGRFQPTKNLSSHRKISLDSQLIQHFFKLIKDFPKDSPIFVKDRVFNSTVNQHLARRCKQANIPVITIHALRHTHASLLLFADVSIASVAKRLGHSNITTTQETYLHIVEELENKDREKISNYLSQF